MYLKTLMRCFLIITLIAYAKSKPSVVELDEDNWHEMLEGEWMVEFFAPWCPACKALQPIWKDFATWSDDLGISVGQVDVTSSPGLSGRFMVTALPTIFHIKDGIFRQYRGSRDKEEFMSFIEEKKWENLEAVPGWKSPASYQMSLVAQFFKLSMVLRGVHTTMVEEFGLPTWFSYLIFAVATIIVGAILGLILVCTIDFLFPPKPMQPVHAMPVPTKSRSKSSDEDDNADSEAKDDARKGGESPDEEELTTEEELASEQPASGDNSPAENSEPEANISPSSSPNVRKRRARKDD